LRSDLIECQRDLAADQAMIVYLTCLDLEDQAFCDNWLCEQYPDAQPCGGD
jgi:hypothetical protein